MRIQQAVLILGTLTWLGCDVSMGQLSTTDAGVSPMNDASVFVPGSDGGSIVPPGLDAWSGTDAGTMESPDAAAVVVPSTCGATALAEPMRGMALYFADCAEGAEVGCVAGNDAAPGTSPDAPRRTVSGLDLDALPAGTQLLFARGGAWSGMRLAVRNENATASAPLVMAAYTPSWGGSARPWIRVTEGTALELGGYTSSAPTAHGGYLVEGLHLDGEHAASWGFWVRDGAEDVVIRDCEIDGFEIGIHFGGPMRTIERFSIVSNHIHHNSQMGLLGYADDLLIESNRIERNNETGSGLHHGIYLGGHGQRLRARNNVLAYNSVVGGRCTGGNFTMHGHWEGAVIEGNTILQDVSDDGCFGFSITPSYFPEQGSEYFRGFVLRGNTVVNTGSCAFCLGAAPGVVIESNVVVSNRSVWSAAVSIPAIDPGEGDVRDEGATIRNNTFYWSAPAATPVLQLGNAGAGLTVVSNLVFFPDASGGSRFLDASDAQLAMAATNLVHGAAWSRTHATLPDAQAAGLDLGGMADDPQLVTMPTADNGWDVTLAEGSPAVDRGHATASATTDRSCGTRVVPDIGASDR